ncbi:MAG: pyruvate kinase [Anaerolineae bacterium]|nr:MAG: pyruvate kinase [Anaerolineae bacterium]
MERRAKIVATIGPASSDERTLQAIIQAGVNVARLNFSHGKYEDHKATIDRVRGIAHRLGLPLGIMQDLQGPKIRTGNLGKDGVSLETNQAITLTTHPQPNGGGEIPVDFPDLPYLVKAGSRILLDDGNLELAVTGVTNEKVQATVILGGVLKSNKGINLPGTQLNIPGFTQKDEEDLAFGLANGIDAVAISFVRSAQDVARVRQAISRLAPDKIDTPIIAKLERPEALDNLDEIVDVADGVMVARGDLGVEMPPERVPIAQKRIIDAANKKGKIVITATQMLDSMIHNPRPTRAEASDVANAIFDGTDAVMLSGETAAGKYPVEAVSIMDAIILEAEANKGDWGHWKGATADDSGDDATSICLAARELAHDLNVAAIVVFTQTGRTARLMSKALPRVPILGFTPETRAYQRMAFYWGVFPYQIPYATTIEEMLAHVDSAMVAYTPIKPGQQVVVISGFPVGAMRLPNFALLYTVGQRS